MAVNCTGADEEAVKDVQQGFWSKYRPITDKLQKGK